MLIPMFLAKFRMVKQGRENDDRSSRIPVVAGGRHCCAQAELGAGRSGKAGGVCERRTGAVMVRRGCCARDPRATGVSDAAGERTVCVAARLEALSLCHLE